MICRIGTARTAKKVLSTPTIVRNGASLPADFLEHLGLKICFHMSVYSWLLNGQKDLLVLLVFWDNFIITFICRKAEIQSYQIIQEYFSIYWYITRIYWTNKTKFLSLFVNEKLQHPCKLG